MENYNKHKDTVIKWIHSLDDTELNSILEDMLCSTINILERTKLRDELTDAILIFCEVDPTENWWKDFNDDLELLVHRYSKHKNPFIK